MSAFGEIEVFVRVVDARSFTRAARSLGLTPSGVSRVVGRLEQRLGVRLLQRTTRSLALTDEGAAYHARCTRILADLAEAEATIGRARAAPRGRIRVDAPVSVSRFLLSRALPSFLDAYPDLSVDLTARDHLIDPVAEGIDVTLRMAAPRPSELVSRTLGELRLAIVGAPSYFARRGRPHTPDELGEHTTIGFLVDGAPLPWPFRDGRTMDVKGRLHTNSTDAQREAALAGHGLVYMFALEVAEDLASGALEAVLVEHECPPRPVHALYARGRGAAPKVRVFLEWVQGLLAAGGRRDVSRAPTPVVQGAPTSKP
ncbi:LysR family transcriptional regulator [Sandaracinus amylolyticus]|uniref:LysR family transcriptional regulator n=1 Tax=Sandaracinus amylolyticus TaxID=927083 RepID=UPI001F461340|nr:LysR family transcriptional regulator [Sandaracinus amylolyticus]UJR82243.1 Hypothetical protein I5071_43080 [Sandaracinus amylolyticus]